MAVADDAMQLPIGELEEAHCFAIGIVLEAGGAHHRILSRDRQWRMQPPHRPADLVRLILGAGEGVEAAVRIRLKQIGPALQALGPRQDPRCCFLGMDCSDALQLV